MEKHENAYVTLSIASQKTLFLDVHQRQHIEACGVLLGEIDIDGNWLIEQAHPLRNVYTSPVYFEFAPEELLEVELAYPEKIVGVYHSHPSGFAKASGTDCKNMQRVNKEQGIPWVWLIIRGPFDDTLMQRSSGLIVSSSVLAYHHYSQEGLQRITVKCVEQENTKSPLPS